MKDKERFREYLINNERAKNTIDCYMVSLNIFLNKYGEINRENILDFKRWLLENRKPKTANIRIVAINQYCIFIGHPEYCVKSVKIHRAAAVENVITLKEYQQMLDGLTADGNKKGYWIIKYLAKTGARVSEFINLEKTALEKEYFEMWTKGKMRRIYIPKALIEESREFLMNQPSKYLFCNRQGNKYTARGISQNISAWARKYGVRNEVAHPHSFRHLFAKEFLEHNSNIALLADLMGHSSVNTTAIYLKLSREEQMKQLNEASNW